MEELKKVFDMINVVDRESVELVAYQLKYVARTWFNQWKESRDENGPHPSWSCFKEFLL